MIQFGSEGLSAGRQVICVVLECRYGLYLQPCVLIKESCGKANLLHRAHGVYVCGVCLVFVWCVSVVCVYTVCLVCVGCVLCVWYVYVCGVCVVYVYICAVCVYM